MLVRLRHLPYNHRDRVKIGTYTLMWLLETRKIGCQAFPAWTLQREVAYRCLQHMGLYEAAMLQQKL